MNKLTAQKNEDNEQFTMILYEQSLIFAGKNNMISIKFNQFNDCSLYFLKKKDLF